MQKRSSPPKRRRWFNHCPSSISVPLLLPCLSKLECQTKLQHYKTDLLIISITQSGHIMTHNEHCVQLQRRISLQEYVPYHSLLICPETIIFFGQISTHIPHPWHFPSFNKIMFRYVSDFIAINFAFNWLFIISVIQLQNE